MYEMYQNHTFLIFEFMYLCNPNIQKEEMYDSSYISYIGNFRESVNFKLTIFDLKHRQKIIISFLGYGGLGGGLGRLGDSLVAIGGAVGVIHLLPPIV